MTWNQVNKCVQKQIALHKLLYKDWRSLTLYIVVAKEDYGKVDTGKIPICMRLITNDCNCSYEAYRRFLAKKHPEEPGYEGPCRVIDCAKEDSCEYRRKYAKS